MQNFLWWQIDIEVQKKTMSRLVTCINETLGGELFIFQVTEEKPLANIVLST